MGSPVLNYVRGASRRARRLRWVRRVGFVLLMAVAVVLGRWEGPPIWELYRLLRLLVGDATGYLSGCAL